MDYEKAKEYLLSHKEFREEYLKPDLAYDISKSIIDARIKKGLSQAELAENVGTKQSSIARAESGNALPSLSFLVRIANALGYSLEAPKFVEGSMTLAHDNLWSSVFDEPLKEIYHNLDSNSKAELVTNRGME